MNAVRLRDIVKRYDCALALEGVSLEIPRGAIFGLLGPNGAGKSTLLRTLLGLVGRDAGEVELLGCDPVTSRGVLDRVGYLPEESGLYRGMKVLEALIFFARLKGLSRRRARSRAESWLESTGLAGRRDDRVETLSKGMARKLQFIASSLHDPELLVLDEPASGLDPVSQSELSERIRSARRGGATVILSTHHMAHAEELCDAVCILAGGRVRVRGSVDELRSGWGRGRYRIATREPSERTEKFMRDGAGCFVSSRRRDESRCWDVELAPHADVRVLLAALSQLDVPVTRFESLRPSLHEIFVETLRTPERGADG